METLRDVLGMIPDECAKEILAAGCRDSATRFLLNEWRKLVLHCPISDEEYERITAYQAKLAPLLAKAHEPEECLAAELAWRIQMEAETNWELQDDFELRDGEWVFRHREAA